MADRIGQNRVNDYSTIESTGITGTNGTKKAVVHTLMDNAKGVRSQLSVAVQPDNTTRRLLLAANSNRVQAGFYNNTGNAIYLGGSNVSSTIFQYKLPANSLFIDDGSISEWWGVTASGTADIQGWETAMVFA